MPGDKTIKVLQGGSVLAEWGPMRLIISAFVGKVPQVQMCARAGEESFLFFESIAGSRRFLGREYRKFQGEIHAPLPSKMIESVLAVGDEDLTPMAAVAGTIADGVADFLARRGMTKVVVDNGGDVAIRLQGDDPVTVGVKADLDETDISRIISLGPERSSWGVATSGLGGRSLTRGVASAATVVAATASLADAAATAVANASHVEDPEVVRRPAEEVDPYTDIAGLPVTVRAGLLREEKKTEALTRAMGRAQELIEKNVILGAFVAVKGTYEMTKFFRDRLVEQP
jgi:ApbE superfamily uncharacterized protein (UPF0280 family)